MNLVQLGFLLMRVALGIHATVDAVHALCVLFPTLVLRLTGDLLMSFMPDLYYGLFGDTLDEPVDPLLRRILCYWFTAMSLTRAVAFAVPITELLIAAALMYALEALALQYEVGMRAVLRRPATVASVISLVMCAGLVALVAVAMRGAPA